jgi:hypothetical protein
LNKNLIPLSRDHAIPNRLKSNEARTCMLIDWWQNYTTFTSLYSRVKLG